LLAGPGRQADTGKQAKGQRAKHRRFRKAARARFRTEMQNWLPSGTVKSRFLPGQGSKLPGQQKKHGNPNGDRTSTRTSWTTPKILFEPHGRERELQQPTAVKTVPRRPRCDLMEMLSWNHHGSGVMSHSHQSNVVVVVERRKNSSDELSHFSQTTAVRTARRRYCTTKENSSAPPQRPR